MRSGKAYWRNTLLKPLACYASGRRNIPSSTRNMSRSFIGLAACAAILVCPCLPSVLLSQTASSSSVVMVIHGGAGTILKQNMTPELEKAYIDTLAIALRTGYQILSRGGSSLDAVEATIRVMEDCPLFNAATTWRPISARASATPGSRSSRRPTMS